MSPRKKRDKKSKKYKLKTHKATAKRFRRTGSGKILRTKGYQSHLRRRKSKRAKRQISRMHEVQSSKLKQTIKRLLRILADKKAKNEGQKLSQEAM
jgi:large subunit ribosomal protein L35